MRWATPQDYDELGDIMHRAIHAEPSPYTPAERTAWRDVPYAGAAWAERLNGKSVLIAEEDGTPVGFSALEPGGYVDFAYLLPDARGRGHFRALLDAIESEARTRGERRLWTHASLGAEGPFLGSGFTVLEREVVQMNGQSLRRALMEKPLAETPRP